MIQQLSFAEIAAKIHPDTTVIGIGSMFSTLWPLVNKSAWMVRERCPRVWIALGEAEERVVELPQARQAGRPLVLAPECAPR
jgi:hypothetical protein